MEKISSLARGASASDEDKAAVDTIATKLEKWDRSCWTCLNVYGIYRSNTLPGRTSQKRRRPCMKTNRRENMLKCSGCPAMSVILLHNRQTVGLPGSDTVRWSLGIPLWEIYLSREESLNHRSTNLKLRYSFICYVRLNPNPKPLASPLCSGSWELRWDSPGIVHKVPVIFFGIILIF